MHGNFGYVKEYVNIKSQFMYCMYMQCSAVYETNIQQGY